MLFMDVVNHAIFAFKDHYLFLTITIYVAKTENIYANLINETIAVTEKFF